MTGSELDKEQAGWLKANIFMDSEMATRIENQISSGKRLSLIQNKGFCDIEP